MFYDNDIQYKVTKYCNILNHQGSFLDRYFSMWSELDFGDIEYDLASRLTDDDIAAVLSCINAFEKLKTLSLTGCVSISGKGLLTLQGSKVLERVDMGLVGRGDSFESGYTLSETIVLPILDSIINTEGNSLKYIQFPKSWQYCPNSISSILGFKNGELDTFLAKYKQSQTQRNMRCTNCDKQCRDALSTTGSRVNNVDISQDFTCYNCLDKFCYDCRDGPKPRLSACLGCEKEFCSDCVKMIPCATCEEEDDHDEDNVGFQTSYYCSSECAKRITCNDCKRVLCGRENCGKINTCNGCDRSGCGDCMIFLECEYTSCKESHCVRCIDNGENTVSMCTQCNFPEHPYFRSRPMKTYCFRHRLKVSGLCGDSRDFMSWQQQEAEMCLGCMQDEFFSCMEKLAT